MKRRLLLVAAAALAGIGGVVALSGDHPGVVHAACSPGRTLGEARTGTFARGGWSWFADPRALRAGDRYYVGWIGWRGQIVVAQYDTACNSLRVRQIGSLFHDDHGNPALLLEPDGRLTAFWSGHDGPRMDYRTTVAPGSITAWGPLRHIEARIQGGLGFTYPNPLMLGGSLYLFMRGPDWSADYATRTGAGTWGPVHELIRNPGQRPYVKVASDGVASIGLAFTNGHPRETTTSVYFAALRAGRLWHADGHPVGRAGGTPIRPARGDLVYNGRASGVSSWVWDVAYGRDGRPVVLYATFPSPRDHEYWYARFDGRRWLSYPITDAGPTISPHTIETEYSGGLVFDHSDPSVVYLSRKVRGSFEIERWVTSDRGARWSHSTVVRTAGGDVRPVVPRGPDGGGIALLWLQGRYGSYTSYRTSIGYLR